MLRPMQIQAGGLLKVGLCYDGSMACDRSGGGAGGRDLSSSLHLHL